MTERGDSGRGSGSCRSGPAGPTSARGRRPSAGALRRDGICRGSVRCGRGADHHHHDAPRRRAADRARARWRDPADRSRRPAATGGSAPHPVVPQRAQRRLAPTRRRSASSSPPCGSAGRGPGSWPSCSWDGPTPSSRRSCTRPPTGCCSATGASTTGSVVGCSATRRSRRPTSTGGPTWRTTARSSARTSPTSRSTSATRSRATRSAASSVRDATGQTGWKLLKGLLRACRSSDAGPRRTPARSSRCSSCSSASRPWPATRWLVLAAVVPAVPHGLAGHQPAALHRRARRHEAARTTAARPPTPCASTGRPAFVLVPYCIGWHLAHHVDSGHPHAATCPATTASWCARATSPRAWSTPATRRSGGRSRPGRPARRRLRRRRTHAAAQA